MAGNLAVSIGPNSEMMGVEIGCGMIATTCRGLSVALEQPMHVAQIFARQQPVVYVDETGDSPAMRWRQSRWEARLAVGVANGFRAAVGDRHGDGSCAEPSSSLQRRYALTAAGLLSRLSTIVVSVVARGSEIRVECCAVASRPLNRYLLQGLSET